LQVVWLRFVLEVREYIADGDARGEASRGQ